MVNKSTAQSRRRNKKKDILEVNKIKKATTAIKQASDQGVDKLNRVVKNIEKVEKKNRLVMAQKSEQVKKQDKKIDQTIEEVSEEAKRGAQKLVRSANRLESINRRNLVITIWVSVGVAVLSMILNVILVIMRVK